MAVIGSGVSTLIDWAKLAGDDKNTAIVELLSQSNEIIDDMLWKEGNLPTGHKFVVRTSLPTVSLGQINKGTAMSKSTGAEVVETCSQIVGESQVDVRLANLNGNTMQYRLSQTSGFLQSLTQQLASLVIYGNAGTNPLAFNGLATRYNSVNTATTQLAANVIDAGGTGSDNSSIYIVGWGPQTVHGIFPKGMPTGLMHSDKGEIRVYDTDGNPYYAYVDNYQWHCGMAIEDWRYVVRISNIDVSDLNTGSAANLISAIIRGLGRLPTAPVGATAFQGSDQNVLPGAGSTAIYCNRTIRSFLDIQATNKTNVLLQLDQFNGKPVTTFRGIPVRTVDAILNTEARVI
jgi:hypothetical protein